MLLARPAHIPAFELSATTDISNIPWFDLINPTNDEITLAERLLNIYIPKREELEEIESSSRHYERNGSLYLSTPLVTRNDEGASAKPVGLVFTKTKIITIRYQDYPSFDAIGRRLTDCPINQEVPPASEILIELIEEIINRLADTLEALGRSLDTISRRVFKTEYSKNRAHTGSMLRETLRRLGNAADLASLVRDSLLGIDRIRIYLDNYLIPAAQPNQTSSSETAAASPFHGNPTEHYALRLQIAARDIASLNDFDAQTVSKVQFLLDATLGFISIEQNDGMKILTVASCIGIMPTLIAGIYGMNFHDIPELSWRYGYPYCLILMALSIILPLIWFWRKGWFGRN
ncbi:CorA family divalent cation transporter [Swingsia samuiensis]|uniref:Magnesium transporter n=1 Tax=Swingsia samuiensis TaxID=1293412 RepID=A0A4Y6UGW9_9PROT|nr:CorA family divalent cation transporter [Swingsia samuiensis]QDH16803.1 magnesium transporter [Swingsia samuiensis]